MKLSLAWVGRYVPIDDLAPDRIRDDLTMSTAEIEGIEPFGHGLDDVVIGRVLEVGAHPQADRLHVCRVDVGAGAPVTIVCGAPNVASDMRVAVALPGATLPAGLRIEKARIRGVESFGMVCSERELGLSEAHEGVLALDADAPIGKKVVESLPVRDWVLDIDNKSINHRPDLWGHYGFARELAAIYDRPLAEPAIALELPSDGERVAITIEDLADCPRFTGLVLKGAAAAPSPSWMRWLLRAVGQRPINVLVDLTNFVMLELGQPMHAFDLRRIDPAGVSVRRARQGERMRTIDGVERRLEPSDLVVASGDRPVGLAGLMGGEASAVQDDTNALFLESANFQPALIRRTSIRLGLRTDASARFEKALDPAQAETGSRRFVHLLRELCPGADAAGPLCDPAQWRYAPRHIHLRRRHLDRKLGVVVDDTTVERILDGLQFRLQRDGSDWQVTVPSFRATKDVTIEDDLVEEVGRMFRYDNIPERPIVSVVEPPPREPELFLGRELVRLGALEAGCHEVYHYSFVADALVAAVGLEDAPHARLRNPVAPEAARVRRHVMPSLLSAVAGNLRERAEVRLLELGKGYQPERRDEHGLPHEVFELALVFARREGEPPFAALRSHVEALLRRVGRPVTFDTTRLELPWIHPARTAGLRRGDLEVGYVGVLHPSVARGLELTASAAIATIDVRALLASGRDPLAYRPIPRFPSQPVDVALLVPSATRVGTIAGFLREAGGALVREVTLFEVYRGAGVPDGMKSLNFTVTLGAEDRTLEAADEERYLNAVRAGAASVGAELRG